LNPTFQAFGLNERILRALEKIQYSTPTPVQTAAIPLVLEGADLIAGAQTGTGKTAAFALPMLHKLVDLPRTRYPRALVLAPTRELARQIAEAAESFAQFTNVRIMTVYGGAPIFKQIRRLQKGVDVVIATPGRAIDLLQQGQLVLDEVELLVLDEADQMLDMGFVNDIYKLADNIPNKPQTVMFSATMPPAIQKLAEQLLEKPEFIRLANTEAATTVRQEVFHVKRNQKVELLEQILTDEAKGQTLIFTRTKAWADQLNEQLRESGFRSAALHGDIRQSKREKVLGQFRSGQCKVLVATDVAARGLDVRGVDVVINYDMPTEAETYVHRIGRTGRAGAEGLALTFCSGQEQKVLQEIEQVLNTALPVREGYAAEVRQLADVNRFGNRGGGGSRRNNSSGGGGSRGGYQGGGYQGGGGRSDWGRGNNGGGNNGGGRSQRRWSDN
jgi:ATP-dependent RNA helicase RhlE